VRGIADGRELAVQDTVRVVSNSIERDVVSVRPQSTVEYTSVASVSTVECILTNLIHDRCSSDVEWLCLTGLQRHPYLVCSHSRLFTLGWMCPLKHEQARRERESELGVVNLV